MGGIDAGVAAVVGRSPAPPEHPERATPRTSPSVSVRHTSFSRGAQPRRPGEASRVARRCSASQDDSGQLSHSRPRRRRPPLTAPSWGSSLTAERQAGELRAVRADDTHLARSLGVLQVAVEDDPLAWLPLRLAAGRQVALIGSVGAHDPQPVSLRAVVGGVDDRSSVGRPRRIVVRARLARQLTQPAPVDVHRPRCRTRSEERHA